MRKTVLVLLAAFLTLALTASCGKKEEPKNGDDLQRRIESGSQGESDRAA